MRALKSFVLVFFIAIAGCGGRVKLDQQSNVATKPGVLSVWAEWVKDKEDKYDIRLNIKNEADNDIIIMLAGIRCYRGNVPGQIKHTFFNTGERTMDFRAGELKTFNLVCRYGTDTKGDFRIVIEKVFDNPANDGRTAGKVIGEKIEWKQPDTGS